MWKVSEYTKKQINEAGKKIIDPNISEEEAREARAVIDNWRAAHAFPMNTFAIQLRRRTKDIEGAVVVQRIKRLESIKGKLKRKEKMELYRMQDLGGCRVIVPTVSDVYTVVNDIRHSRIRHIELTPKDYIAIPNPETGYRSYHMCYRYKSEKNSKYDGLRIELQIRTKMQHLWATAVETVGLFTQNGLKFNQGDEDWLLFFKLVSALFSWEEQTAVVEGVPENRIELMMELMKVEQKLRAIMHLVTIGVTTQSVGHLAQNKRPGYYIISLLFAPNKKNISLNVEKFLGMEKGLDAATKRYNELEARRGKGYINSVLVSAQSYENLVVAYPNYFADITEFTALFLELMKKYAIEANV